MRVRDFNKDEYLVVVRKYWNSFHDNAFVERICYDEDDARYTRDSLERSDGISFVIIKNGGVVK